jgi:hypothetical protein
LRENDGTSRIGWQEIQEPCAVECQGMTTRSRPALRVRQRALNAKVIRFRP